MKKTFIALSIASILLAAGCGGSGGPAEADQHFVNAAGYVKDLHASYGNFTWPEDHQPDLEVLAAHTSPPPNAQMEAGHERVVLGIVNACSWYLSWDSARQRSLTPAIEHALSMMEKALPGLHRGDPSGQKLAEEIATKARLGDPAPAMGFVSANCDTVKWR